MSVNSLVVIYKFRDQLKVEETKYFVYYAKNNLFDYDTNTFNEFRNSVISNWCGKKFNNLSDAIEYAKELEKYNIPEYCYIIYDGYYNAFYEDGYPNSPFISLEVNKEYIEDYLHVDSEPLWVNGREEYY